MKLKSPELRAASGCEVRLALLTDALFALSALPLLRNNSSLLCTYPDSLSGREGMDSLVNDMRGRESVGATAIGDLDM